MTVSIFMSNDTILLVKRVVATSAGGFTLLLTKEDLTETYPGMYRYCLAVLSGTRLTKVFRTNTYEYSPGCPLDAETVCKNRMNEWERELKENPADFQGSPEVLPPGYRPCLRPDVVVIQGSPRGGGNCSTLAGWVVDCAHDLGKTVRVIYPDDMGIHPCIGCYQCYNSGTCTFTDDMEEIIVAFGYADLIVICSPVYTNTVPGTLKILIDRCLAWHAARTLGQGRKGQKGVLVAVSGRKGQSNFRCVSAVIHAFMENTGVTCMGDLLFDEMDYHHDVRDLPGIQEKVSDLIGDALK